MWKLKSPFQLSEFSDELINAKKAFTNFHVLTSSMTMSQAQQLCTLLLRSTLVLCVYFGFFFLSFLLFLATSSSLWDQGLNARHSSEGAESKPLEHQGIP